MYTKAETKLNGLCGFSPRIGLSTLSFQTPVLERNAAARPPRKYEILSNSSVNPPRAAKANGD